MRETTCCFTGHRPNKLPWGYAEQDPRCAALKKWLREQLLAAWALGYRRFLCGMALGCDTYFCEEALALRETECPTLVLEAAVPFRAQAEKWPEADRLRHRRLLDACDIVSVLQQDYTPDCMAKRNRYMIEQSSRLICVYDGVSGGTLNTLLYAMRSELEVVQADLHDFSRAVEPWA